MLLLQKVKGDQNALERGELGIIEGGVPCEHIFGVRMKFNYIYLILGMGNEISSGRILEIKSEKLRKFKFFRLKCFPSPA